MFRWLKWLVFALVAPPEPVVDLFRRLRTRGRAVVVLDLAALQARVRSGDGLETAIRTVEQMRRDPQVRGLRLRLHHTHGGWGDLHELRSQLAHLRASGREVFAELSSVGNADLFLSSCASRVFLVPGGEIRAGGLSARLTFVGRALERLGIHAEILTAGRYKNLGETVSRSHPSEASRESLAELVADLQERLVEAVAQGRGISRESVREALEEVPLSPEEALARKMVDAIAWPDQVEDAIRDQISSRFRPMAFSAYRRWSFLRGLHRRLVGFQEGVPIVHLSGPVVMHPPGGQRSSVIAARQVVPLLDRLRRAPFVRAVVLTVDSSGGGALASDLVWRAVSRLQERVPVVAVFRNVAASGGYYLAVAAGEIRAQPTTITGSIGVVAGKLVLMPALSRLGVDTAVIRGAASADMEGAGRRFTSQERRRLDRSVERAYRLFLARVSAGRRRPVRAVEPVAEGRVWTGHAARRHGLVDDFGTVEDAWIRACELARLRPDPRVTGRPEIRTSPVGPLRRLFGSLRLHALGLSGRLSPLSALLLDILEGAHRGADSTLVPLATGEAEPGEPLALLPQRIRID